MIWPTSNTQGSAVEFQKIEDNGRVAGRGSNNE